MRTRGLVIVVATLLAPSIGGPVAAQSPLLTTLANPEPVPNASAR